MPILSDAFRGRPAGSGGTQLATVDDAGRMRPSDTTSHLYENSGHPEGRIDAPGVERAMLAVCANPMCTSGWLHLWRRRSAPIFERGWTCSPECTAARLDAAVRREMDGVPIGYRMLADSEQADVAASTQGGRVIERHAHRIPLGLTMLRQGWISQAQLRKALQAQREAGRGKLGHWLVRQQATSEELVARAVAMQWGCPMLSENNYNPQIMAAALPRLLVEGFGALPLRVAGDAMVYLGFAERLDPVVALAMQRMLGLQIESGIVQDSRFSAAQGRMLSASFPAVTLLEARSESVLVRVLTKEVESAKPVEARLVRVHDCLWLRMWLRRQEAALPDVSGVRDVICTLAGN